MSTVLSIFGVMTKTKLVNNKKMRRPSCDRCDGIHLMETRLCQIRTWNWGYFRALRVSITCVWLVLTTLPCLLKNLLVSVNYVICLVGCSVWAKSCLIRCSVWTLPWQVWYELIIFVLLILNQLHTHRIGYRHAWFIEIVLWKVFMCYQLCGKKTGEESALEDNMEWWVLFCRLECVWLSNLQI